MSEYAEDHVEKVSVPPLVHDSTLPSASDDDDAGPKTGVLVAVVGEPIDGGSPVYDAALGYCVWQPALTADDFITEGGELLTEGGNLITETE